MMYAFNLTHLSFRHHCLYIVFIVDWLIDCIHAVNQSRIINQNCILNPLFWHFRQFIISKCKILRFGFVVVVVVKIQFRLSFLFYFTMIIIIFFLLNTKCSSHIVNYLVIIRTYNNRGKKYDEHGRKMLTISF